MSALSRPPAHSFALLGFFSGSQKPNRIGARWVSTFDCVRPEGELVGLDKERGVGERERERARKGACERVPETHESHALARRGLGVQEVAENDGESVRLLGRRRRRADEHRTTCARAACVCARPRELLCARFGSQLSRLLHSLKPLCLSTFFHLLLFFPPNSQSDSQTCLSCICNFSLTLQESPAGPSPPPPAEPDYRRRK